MGYALKKVAHSPEVDELTLDYGYSAPDMRPAWEFSTDFGAAQVEAEPIPSRASADVLRDRQYWDEPAAFPVTRVEQGWLQGEVERLGAETEEEDEIVLSHVLERRLNPSLPAFPTDYFRDIREEYGPTLETPTPIEPAPTPHAGSLISDRLAPSSATLLFEAFSGLPPSRAPATIPEMILELQERVRRGSDFEPTFEHLTNKLQLEELKRIGQTPEQISPVVRAVGPGLGGSGILMDTPAWSGPSKGRPPTQQLKPVGRR